MDGQYDGKQAAQTGRQTGQLSAGLKQRGFTKSPRGNILMATSVGGLVRMSSALTTMPKVPWPSSAICSSAQTVKLTHVRTQDSATPVLPARSVGARLTKV